MCVYVTCLNLFLPIYFFYLLVILLKPTYSNVEIKKNCREDLRTLHFKVSGGEVTSNAVGEGSVKRRGVEGKQRLGEEGRD